jgi:hypothetical protein
MQRLRSAWQLSQVPFENLSEAVEQPPYRAHFPELRMFGLPPFLEYVGYPGDGDSAGIERLDDEVMRPGFR